MANKTRTLLLMRSLPIYVLDPSFDLRLAPEGSAQARDERMAR